MLFYNRRRAAFLAVLLSLSCLASEAQVRQRNAAAEMVARAEEHEKKLRLDVEELLRLTADLRDNPSTDAKQKLDRVEKLAKSIRLMMLDVNRGLGGNIPRAGSSLPRWGQHEH